MYWARVHYNHVYTCTQSILNLTDSDAEFVCMSAFLFSVSLCKTTIYGLINHSSVLLKKEVYVYNPKHPLNALTVIATK